MELIFNTLEAEFETTFSPDGEKVTGRTVGAVNGFAVVQFTADELTEINSYPQPSFEDALNEWAQETGSLDGLLPDALIIKSSVWWRVCACAHKGKHVCLEIADFESDAETIEEMRERMQWQINGK